MTIKRAVLITTLTAITIGLIALGIKTNSFDKENLKNSFKTLDTQQRHRNAPIRTDATNENEIHEINDVYEVYQTDQWNSYEDYNTKYLFIDPQDETPQLNILTNYGLLTGTMYEFQQRSGNNYYVINDVFLEFTNQTSSTLNFKVFANVSNIITAGLTVTQNIIYDYYETENISTNPFNLTIDSQTRWQVADIIDNTTWNQHDRQTTTNSTVSGQTNAFRNIHNNIGLPSNTTKYILLRTVIETPNCSTAVTSAQSLTITGSYIQRPINQEVVPIVPMMYDILTMPFTFITTAFNVTLFKGTPYQFNFSNFILSLIAIATLIFIIKLFTSGFSIIGNYTSNREDRAFKRSQTKLNNAKTEKIKREK